MQKQGNQPKENANSRSNLFRVDYSKLLPDFKEERTQKFTTIVLTVLTLAFFGLFAINPTVSTIIKLRKELEDNNFVDSKLVQKINNLSTLQKKYTELQSDLPMIFAAVPQSPEVPLMVAQIQSIAKNSNVSIENFQSFAVEIPTKTTPSSYASFSFALSLSGTYNDLYRFLTSLSNMQRVVSVELISFTKKTLGNSMELSIKGKAFFNP